MRCSRLILCISCPQVRFRLLQEAWFLSLENGIRNQELDIRFGHCSQTLSPDRAVCVFANLSPFSLTGFTHFNYLDQHLIPPLSSVRLFHIFVIYLDSSVLFYIVLESLNS